MKLFRFERRSRWRKIIDRCPDRGAHLREAVGTVWDDECVVGGWSLGAAAVLQCLKHTFELSYEELGDLGRQLDAEREDPDEDRPAYRGGHPRIPDGSEWEGWYSTRDLEELIESRANELDNPDEYCGSIVSAEYLVDTPDEWTSSLDHRRLDDTGWLTTNYINANESYVTGVLGSWAPFGDKASMRKAVLDAFPAWWFMTAPGSDAGRLWGDPAVFVEGLARLCRSDWMDAHHEWRHIKRSVLGNLDARPLVAPQTWRSLGISVLPPDEWWSSLSEAVMDARLSEEGFVEPLIAFYVALRLEESAPKVAD